MIYNKLKELIEPNGVIVEIGAHIGTDTVKLYRLLKPLTYCAIEPDNRNWNALILLDLPIIIIPFAVSDTNERATWHLSYGTTPNGRLHTDSNSLMKPKNNASWVEFKEAQIECRTLDFLMGNIVSCVDLIWMDVQGAELKVLEGAKETLKLTKYIYTECQEGRYHGQPGLEGIMEALPGWKFVLKNGNNVLLRNDETTWNNYYAKK